MIQAVIDRKNSGQRFARFTAGLLILLQYYQGLQKCLAFNSYRFWLQHAPVIKPWAILLTYALPALQLLLAAMLIPAATRRAALVTIILTQLIFILWVAYVFYATPYLFWPWRAFWPQPNWFQKFLEALAVGWFALWSLKWPRNDR